LKDVIFKLITIDRQRITFILAKQFSKDSRIKDHDFEKKTKVRAKSDMTTYC